MVTLKRKRGNVGTLHLWTLTQAHAVLGGRRRREGLLIMLISSWMSGQPEVLKHEQSAGGLNDCFLLVIPVFCFSPCSLARRGVSDAAPSCRRLVLRRCSEVICEEFVPCEPDTRRDLHDVDRAAVLSLPTRSPVKPLCSAVPVSVFERALDKRSSLSASFPHVACPN